MSNWLAELKVGDEVVIEDGFTYTTLSLVKADRLTPAQGGMGATLSPRSNPRAPQQDSRQAAR